MYKRILFIFFIVLLTIPFVQYHFNVFELKKLDGAFVLNPEPKLSFKSWMDGTYQQKLDKHLEDSIGFRSFLIRTYNQVSYSLFNMARSPGSVVGKDDQLFLRSYIDGYLGTTFKGKEVLDDELHKMKFIQDTLEKLGKTLLLVFAPGKASYYTEYLPDEYDPGAKKLNNYEYYIQKCNELGINNIDLLSWFRKLKGKTVYPLYPRNGVHWSSYGMYIGIDSIVKYIENKRQIDLPDIVVDEVKMSENVVHPDRDVEENMNTLFEIESPPMPYLKYSFVKKDTSVKPKVLAISDSYYWQVYGAQIPQNVFDWGGFWFYFKTIHPERNGKLVSVDSVNLRNELFKQDVIMIMGTEATLHMFPYGFIEKSYRYFIPEDRNSLIEYYKDKIRKDKGWYAGIIDKAKANNVDIEEQLTRDAAFMVDQEKEKTPEQIDPKEKMIQKIMNDIKSDPKWYKYIVQKAKENKISEEEQLRLDALWDYNNKVKSESL